MSDAHARAEAARRLLNDPLLLEVLDTVEATAIASWSATGLDGEAMRERCWYALKASQRLREVLKGIVDNGLIEATRAVR